MKYEVANIADLFADVVITGKEKPSFGQVETLAETYEIEVGGSGPIFSSQYAKLGGSIAMLTIVGQDAMGDFVLKRLKEIGIDNSFVQTSQVNKTPLGLNISIQQDRSLLTVLGTLSEITPELIDDALLENIKHWHIAGYYLLPQLISFWPGFIDKLKDKGITVSLDTNWSPEGNWDQVQEILPKVDLFLPNQEEALAITGQSTYAEAGLELSRQVSLVVVKRGEKGASAFQNGIEYPASNEEYWEGDIQVVDTTGAGDSFDGGFIYEWLRGYPIQSCLKTALICGISNVQGIGGIQSQYSKTD